MTLFVRRRWPKVVAAVGVLAVLAGVVAWLVTRDSDPAASRIPDDDVVLRTGDPVPDPTPPSVELAAVLAAPDARLTTYAEKTVDAPGVLVLSVVGPSAAWVGESTTDRVLIVLVSTTAKGFDFEPGVRLSFTGTVRKAETGFGAALGLSGADNAEFERQRAYVEVDEYAVV